MDRLSDPVLDRLFRAARTHRAWRPEAVAESLLRELYDLTKWGPTSANTSPARFVFLTNDEAKARLAPYLWSANLPRMLGAPVVVIIAFDENFVDKMPILFPHNPDALSWFDDRALAEETAFRNGSLQGAYLMLAARALGLDCGPMSGFDRNGVDNEFFQGSSWRTNFLCNIGYGSNEDLFERLPRLSFDDACRIL